jgi:hypothetical protein
LAVLSISFAFASFSGKRFWSFSLFNDGSIVTNGTFLFLMSSTIFIILQFNQISVWLRIRRILSPAQIQGSRCQLVHIGKSQPALRRKIGLCPSGKVGFVLLCYRLHIQKRLGSVHKKCREPQRTGLYAGWELVFRLPITAAD